MKTSISPTDQIGPYRIENRLGAGGMGEVYRAHDDRLDRQVALKVLHSDAASNPIANERLRREARAAAALTHPSIVQIYDILEWEGHDCVVMELIKGRNLADVSKDGPLPLQSVVTLGREVAEGLAEAHGQGIVHRDLKTENVMVTSAGHAKILDFGVAKRTALDYDEPSLSVEGLVVGTCRAMSPEQARGQPVDSRSDMFSFGTLLYEVLSGDSPFQTTTALETLNRVCEHDPPPLDTIHPDIPAELANLVDRLLAKDPDPRPSAQEAVGILESLALGPGAFAAPTLIEGIRPTTGAGTSSTPQVAIKALVLIEPEQRLDLFKTLGEVRANEISERNDHLVRELLQVHDGQEIERLGGSLLLFERPIDAVGFCIDYHQGLHEISEGLERPWRARAGLHLGEVSLRETTRGDVRRGARPIEIEGLAKHVALRLASLAVPGQTLMTRSAFDLARRAVVGSAVADRELLWLAHGAYRLEGLDEPEEVFEVGLAAAAPLRVPPDSEAARREVLPGDEITLGWRAAPNQKIPRRPGWVVQEKLGEGGFGEVWLAVHETTEEKRVFKFCYEAERLRALRREVTLFRLLRESLGHRDDIARILEWNFDEAPYWLESDYTEAGSLLDWATEQGGLDRVPPETRIELVAQVAEALAAAHSVGVLHKDVKPANVLIAWDAEERPKAVLTDFGIGLLTDRSLLAARGISAVGLTELMDDATSATLGGSQIYMAPELLEGRVGTVQADIYALGVLLYQMAVGDFHRALASGWQRHVEDEILREDIASLVDGSPERRPASALEVAQRLRRLDERREARDAERRAQEEEERSRRRRRMLAATAAIAVAVLIVVSLFALREQSARREAERRRQQAEDLIDFMLFDLRDGLESIGRLDLLEQVARESQQYFEELPEEDESPTSATKRGITLLNIGDVLLDQGQSEEALSSYRKALGFFESLTERDPDNLEWQAALARSRTKAGEALAVLGDTVQALEMHREARNSLENLVAHEPDSVEWRLALGHSLLQTSRILHSQGEMAASLTASRKILEVVDSLSSPEGDTWERWELIIDARMLTAQTLIRQGHLEEAREWFDSGLALAETQAKEHPTDLIRQETLAGTHRTLGFGLHDEFNDFSGAFEAFRAARENFERLVALQPANVSWQGNLAICELMIGQIYNRQGDPADAMAALERARTIYQDLIALDPNRLRWKMGIAAVHREIGTTHLDRGEIEQSLASYDEALSIFRDLESRDAANANWSFLARDTELDLVKVHLARGRPRIALESLEALQSDLDSRLARNGSDLLLRLQVSKARLFEGRAYESLGQSSLARAAWLGALDAIEPAAKQAEAPPYLEAKAKALLYLGRVEDARPLLAELRSKSWEDPELEKLAQEAGRLP